MGVARRRAEAQRAKAQASLAAGRYLEALEALRRAGRAEGVETFRDALRAADALFGLQRHRETLGLVNRALGRRPQDGDLAVRLRIVRAQALWNLGRVAPARGELERAAQRAAEPLTRARVAETRGLFAWKLGDVDAASGHLGEARSLYEAGGSAAGLLRVLEKEAGVLREAGRLEEALLLLERRVAEAAGTERLDVRAGARRDRGDLLGVLGRWREARADLDAAGVLFHEAGDPREQIVAGVNRAMLDLVAGDLAAARAALLKADAAMADEPCDPRVRGEVQITWADLHLAAGEPVHAERTAADALGRFTVARDVQGECRSRIRRSHALLGLGRVAEALREARRAMAGAGLRRELEALGALTLGRALLRTRPSDAMAAFERVLALTGRVSGFAVAARLGRALARGAGRDDEDVVLCLAGLEMWGDRRLLSLCQADLRDLTRTCARPVDGLAADALSRPLPSSSGGPAWLTAAVSIAGEGEWSARWAGAMKAVAPVLPWCRAVLAAETGWELRHDLDQPARLGEADLARELAARLTAPAVVDLLSEPAWREHPVRQLHGLVSAALVPTGSGVLYLDRREGQPAFDGDEIAALAQLGTLLARPHERAEPEALSRAVFPEIVGRCRGMELLFERMARVAGCDIWVHVFGETGTGKERVAQALHRHSPRRDRPFVAVNASSLSEELFESEMFGHVRGAFTGAVADREGYVARAQGGTLFIDEVADLSSRAQAKLLRFLAEGEYRRVGESEMRRADVRIVSAANVSLRERVAAGAFRADLMYRLAASMVLELPPLRERGDDVLLLARHFLRRGAARAGVSATPTLPRDVAQALFAYPWPGNIRELESEIDRLLVLSGRGPLCKEHLSPHVAGPRDLPRSSLKDACLAFERRHVAQALAQNGDNRARTALKLGLTRQGLVAKIRRLGL
jgi:DNA-binding NtrC family response regulator/tetratricopeptide (TPR) repeat protein